MHAILQLFPCCMCCRRIFCKIRHSERPSVPHISLFRTNVAHHKSAQRLNSSDNVRSNCRCRAADTLHTSTESEAVSEETPSEPCPGPVAIHQVQTLDNAVSSMVPWKPCLLSSCTTFCIWLLFSLFKCCRKILIYTSVRRCILERPWSASDRQSIAPLRSTLHTPADCFALKCVQRISDEQKAY